MMNHAAAPLDGSDAPAFLRAARSHLDANRHVDAIRSCEQALQTDPSCADALLLLGLVSFEMDQPTQALTFLGQAHNRNPAAREYADALATIHTRIGNLNEGLFYAKLATTLSPNPGIDALIPPRYSNFFASVEKAQPFKFRGRAEFLAAHGYVTDTIEACEKQLELTPDDIETHRILARTARLDGQTSRSIAIGQALICADPANRHDRLELARALSANGLFDEAAAAYDYVLNRWNRDPAVASERLLNTMRNPGAGALEINAEHADWAASCPPHKAKPFLKAADPNRPLRLAYLCRSFGKAELADLAAPVICQHKRQGHDVFVYTEDPGANVLSEHIRTNITKWTDFHGIDELTAAEILRGDRIDIAIDLTGHGIGSRRTTLAQRPAPVSFAWLQEPLAEPNAIDQCYPSSLSSNSEPALFAPFNEPRTCPDVGELPTNHNGYITFGVKADLTSIGAKTASIWAMVLNVVPESRLLIANAKALDEGCIERCATLFTHYGVRERVDVVNMADNFRDHHEFYHHVDVALDGYPLSNLPELYAALWMGVPVLSLQGRDQGLGRRILEVLGVPEWTAETPASYAEAAISLCADTNRLNRFRAGLRERVSASPLVDIRSFVERLESAYRNAWQAWCRTAVRF